MMARSLSSLCCSLGPSNKDSTCRSRQSTQHVQCGNLPARQNIATHRCRETDLSRRLQHRAHDDDQAGCCQCGAHHVEAQLVKQVRTHSQARKGKPAPELALSDLLLQELLRVVAGSHTLDADINLQAHSSCCVCLPAPTPHSGRTGAATQQVFGLKETYCA